MFHHALATSASSVVTLLLQSCVHLNCRVLLVLQSAEHLAETTNWSARYGKRSLIGRRSRPASPTPAIATLPGMPSATLLPTTTTVADLLMTSRVDAPDTMVTGEGHNNTSLCHLDFDLAGAGMGGGRQAAVDESARAVHLGRSESQQEPQTSYGRRHRQACQRQQYASTGGTLFQRPRSSGNCRWQRQCPRAADSGCKPCVSFHPFRCSNCRQCCPCCGQARASPLLWSQLGHQQLWSGMILHSRYVV